MPGSRFQRRFLACSPRGHLCSGPCAIDVSIVHPLAPSVASHSVETGREAVDAMERVKHSKYDRCCNESNVLFAPFVLSTFGQFGVEAERFFHGVTRAARRGVVVDDDLEHPQYRQQLLVCLNREVARQLLKAQLDHVAPNASDLANRPPSPEQDPELTEVQNEYELLDSALAPEVPSSSDTNGPLRAHSGSSLSHPAADIENTQDEARIAG